MVDKPETPQPLTLKRWSQRKLDAARKPVDVAPARAGAPDVASITAPAAVPAAVPAIPGPGPTAAAEVVQLPPVESLDFESDYAAFMQPKVNEETRRAALKKLFSNPSFNVMDGLDIYVGDYTQPDPMPAGMLEKISAVYAMLDPVAPPPDTKSPAGEPAADNGAAPDQASAATDIAAELPPTADAPASDAKKPA